MPERGPRTTDPNADATHERHARARPGHPCPSRTPTPDLRHQPAPPHQARAWSRSPDARTRPPHHRPKCRCHPRPSCPGSTRASMCQQNAGARPQAAARTASPGPSLVEISRRPNAAPAPPTQMPMPPTTVMPGLDPGIHVSAERRRPTSGSSPHRQPRAEPGRLGPDARTRPPHHRPKCRCHPRPSCPARPGHPCVSRTPTPDLKHQPAPPHQARA